MPTQIEPQWISTAVEAPIMATLAWMLHGLRRGISAMPDASSGAPAVDPAALERTRDDLAAFKLEVARTYVPLSLIRDVDSRLTQHLLRIEQKLDEAARSATIAATRVAAMQDDR